MDVLQMMRPPRFARTGVVGLLLAALLVTTGIPGAVAQSPAPAGQSPGPAAQSPGPATSPAPLDPARIAAAAARLRDMAGPLDVDRLLLIELRKKLPQDRAEAEAYLANIEQLALAADPERLGVIVSRVRAAAPAYLDWHDQQFASQAEAQAAYLQSGAAAFDATWSNLREDILLTVANRIDTIIDVVNQMQGGQ